jgi:NADH dehydrogenase [ubiquinone] 1 alpha subcomplex assembly factor 5
MDGPMQVFDLAQLRRARGRAGALRGELVGQALARLTDRLDDVTRKFACALVLGAGAGAASVLRARGIAQVTTADVTTLPAPDLVAGFEALPFAAQKFDVVLAPWCLHWVNDLPGCLVQLRQALQPDGLFLANLPGLGTLAELRDALIGAESTITGRVAPRISPFVDLRDGAGLLQRAGFALPVADADRLVLSYADPLRLMAELRGTGETNAVLARSRVPLRRDVLAGALGRLAKGAAGRVAARLEVVTLTGWAPAPQQQRPLRPGSARTRLAAALGTTETGAGEPTLPPGARTRYMHRSPWTAAR